MQQEYRKEVIQLNRALADQGSQDDQTKKRRPSPNAGWNGSASRSATSWPSPRRANRLASSRSLTVFIAMGFAYVLS